MSTPDPAFDRDEQMLARLAELDLAAVERVHGRLMAAEATAEIADLGRTYQRLARSLRQTLALKAKLKHDRELHRPVGQPPVQAPGHDFDLEGFRIDTRVDALQDAVDRVIVAAHPDAPERQRTCQERLDRELDDWATDELSGWKASTTTSRPPAARWICPRTSPPAGASCPDTPRTPIPRPRPMRTTTRPAAARPDARARREATV